MHNELGHTKGPEQLYKEIEDTMYIEYSTVIPTKPYVIEYLKKLKAQGVKMCVLSASTQKMIEASAKKCGYFDLMEFVLSCDTVGIPKSNPEIFKIIAEKMGLSVEDVTVFDDNLIAVQSAKKSGAKVCGVYDSLSEDFKDEIIELSDQFIYSFEELL